MSIGLGVFLAAAVIALVLLYTATNDRWNWSILVRRTGIAIGGLIVLIVAIVGAYFAYDAIASRPSMQTAYSDLKIGMGMAEVQYAKGTPNNVEVEPDQKASPGLPKGAYLVLSVKDLKPGQHVEQYWRWSYDNENGSRLDLEFDRATRKLNSVFCYSPQFMLCPSLLGIYDGMTEDELIAKLGNPSDQNIASHTKVMTYQSLHVRFYLAKQKVYMLTVFQ